jgi:hypothetical protein
MYDDQVHVTENVHNTSWVVDSQRWPLVYVRPPSSGPNEWSELDAFHRAIIEQVFARRRLHVVLYDMRGVAISSERRQQMTDWSSQRDAVIRPHMLALAVVVSSEEERANVTAGFWSLQRSFHARIFDCIVEAEQWLLAEFARGEGSN